MPPTLSQISISQILMDGLVDYLVEKLQIIQTDDAQAGIVRAGRLQDDPTIKKVNIMVHPGGEAFPDILGTKRFGVGIDDKDLYFETGGGGGVFWKRRYILELILFFMNSKSRTEARQKMQTVLHRCQHYIINIDHNRFAKDDFGEHAYDSMVSKMHVDEGGGDGDYNWRGKLYVEFMTQMENPDEPY